MDEVRLEVEKIYFLERYSTHMAKLAKSINTLKDIQTNRCRHILDPYNELPSLRKTINDLTEVYDELNKGYIKLKETHNEQEKDLPGWTD
jgi:archaellum component FlaC